jgi:hypothetical protein
MSVTVLATVLLSEGIRPLIGWPGYIGVLSAEAVIMTLIVLARRRSISFARALPISLAVFLVWSLASVGWSTYAPQTIAGLALQWVLTFLALGVAVTRDSIQVIRAVGSALRVTLGISLGLELLSGIIVRESFSVWGITGNIAFGGPIQGVAGSRNALATMALIALITFAIELRTKSVTKRVGILSVVGAAIVVLLTQAPLALTLQAMREQVQAYLRGLPAPGAGAGLVGDRLCSADIVVAVLLARLSMAGELPLLEREDLRQWWQRFQARHGFQSADIWSRFQRRRFVQALIEARHTPLAVQD